MSTQKIPGLSEETLLSVASVWSAPDGYLQTLIKAGGLDPKRDFRGGDFRGWPLAGEDVRGIDFTGSDLRETGIELAIRDNSTILTDTLIDKGDQNVTPEHIYSEQEARSAVNNLLIEARRSARGKAYGEAVNLTARAQELINKWQTWSFLEWVPLRVRTSLAHSDYALALYGKNHDDHGGQEIASILDSIVQLVPSNRDAVQVLSRVANNYLTSRFVSRDKDMVLTALRAAAERLDQGDVQWWEERGLARYTLLKAQSDFARRLRDYRAAETYAHQLIQAAQGLPPPADTHGGADLWLQATMVLARVFIANKDEGRAREVLEKAVETRLKEEIQPSSMFLVENDILPGTHDLLRAVRLLFNLSKGDVRYELVARSLNRAKQAAEGPANVSDLHQIASVLQQLADAAILHRDYRMAELIAETEYELRSRIAARSNDDAHRTRLIRAAERYQWVIAHDHKCLDVPTIYSLEKEFHHHLMERPSLRNERNWHRALLLLSGVLRANGAYSEAEETLAKTRNLARTQPYSPPGMRSPSSNER